MSLAFNLLLGIAAFTAMEVAAWATHRWIMHGFGWGWHESHHRPRTGPFERNDRFVLIFSGIAVALFAIGKYGTDWAWPLAWGVTAYGIAYFLMHDVLVHRRIRLPFHPTRGYLGRLVAAHHLHHAVNTKDGAVSFGFLYAPPLPRLRAQLRALRHPASQA
ncbi:beta-carotene hydroxylase [Rhodovastum atsumiense]|uniref:Beta-carotene hydroxylase n=2 Tax=Rhodovastum atsumiense TaxID=504468 RepID=A0A5M6IRQ1_9PROT|nr:beta-carotene hydroxylase [Rhodovastum atsumiense]